MGLDDTTFPLTEVRIRGLLAPSLLRQMLMTVPIQPGYRYGLGITEVDLPCGTGHDGSDAGTQTWVLVTSDRRDEVVMMVNVQDDDTVQPLVLEHVAQAFCAVRPA